MKKIAKESKKRFLITILVIIICLFLFSLFKQSFALTAVNESDYQLVHRNFANSNFTKIYTFLNNYQCYYYELDKEGESEVAELYNYEFDEEKNLIIEECEFRILSNSFMDKKTRVIYFEFEGDLYE